MTQGGLCKTEISGDCLQGLACSEDVNTDSSISHRKRGMSGTPLYFHIVYKMLSDWDDQRLSPLHPNPISTYCKSQLCLLCTCISLYRADPCMRPTETGEGVQLHLPSCLHFLLSLHSLGWKRKTGKRGETSPPHSFALHFLFYSVPSSFSNLGSRRSEHNTTQEEAPDICNLPSNTL